MAFSIGSRLGALCAALLSMACGDDSGGVAGTSTSGSSTSVDPTTGVGEVDSSSSAVCEESESVYEPQLLGSDIVISMGSSLLTPHPVLLAAYNDIRTLYEDNMVRVALIADASYTQIYGDEECVQCIDPGVCDDPVAVRVQAAAIPPIGELNNSFGSYACMFRPAGEAVKHFVAFTDTEPGPGELSDFEAFIGEQQAAGDAAFHVAYMLGCSQMEGGMGLEALALSTGGTSANICNNVAEVVPFLEGLAASRVACGWPLEDPGPNNTSDNLELTLLDGPSGGEMEMVRAPDGMCTPSDGGDAPFEWFVNLVDGVEGVRLCPATCAAVQGNYMPGEVSFRQTFGCPA